MQQIAFLKGRKKFVIAVFFAVALGIGYFSQNPTYIAEYSTEPSPYAGTSPEQMLKSPSRQGSYGSGTSGLFETMLPKEVAEQEHVSFESRVPSIPDTALTFDRLVVFTAKMELNVTSVQGAMQDLQSIAYSLGGYVSDSYVNPIPAGSRTHKGVLAKQTLDASVTLRIPSKNFNDALSRISSLGEVISMSTSNRDVTDEYVDLEARIKNLENALAQYRLIMQDAKETKDILAIQSRIDDIQGQIERLKAQAAQTEKQASFAMITVHLTEPFVIEKDDKPIEEPDTLEKAVMDVINMATSLAQAEARGLLVLTVGLLPAYPILAVGYFVYRKYIAKKSREIQVQ